MEETFANDTSHKVNIQNTQRTYTTQYQKTIWLKTWADDLSRHFPVKSYRWPTSVWSLKNAPQDAGALHRAAAILCPSLWSD